MPGFSTVRGPGRDDPALQAMRKNPFDLSGGEVGIDDQTGPLGKQLGPSPLTNVFANTLALA